MALAVPEGLAVLVAQVAQVAQGDQGDLVVPAVREGLAALVDLVAFQAGLSAAGFRRE